MLTHMQTRLKKAYDKNKPEELRKLAAEGASILQTQTGAKNKASQALEQRLFKMLLQRSIDGGDDNVADGAGVDTDSAVETQVHYVRMTAEEYLRRIKANLGDDCEVPRWPCCSELLAKLQEEALAKQLAEQAAAAASAAAAAAASTTASATAELPQPSATTAPADTATPAPLTDSSTA